MKSCEHYLKAINELVDGTLGPLRRAELELHLESCDDCRALVEDLQQIARAAGALGPAAPPETVWTRVVGRLREEGRIATRPRWTSGRTLSLALAATLVLAVSASLLLLLPRGEAPAPDEGTPSATSVSVDPVQDVASELELTERHFQNAIERATQSDAFVTAETAVVLQKNLLVVNQAIAESRAALEANPESMPAQQSLYEALRQKIQFLQQTIALMNVMRRGDAAGAAELVEGGKS